jgi:hypothetical protein
MMVVYVCYWFRDKDYGLPLIALILVVQSISGPFFAMGSTSTTTIHAQVMPTVTISPPVNPYIWDQPDLLGIVVTSPPGTSVTIQTPTTPLCVSTDPSTYLITYNANIVGGNGYTIQWYMDGTAQNGQNSPTFTYNWYANANWGTHVVSVALLNTAGGQAAMDSKTINVYPKPIASATVTVA